MIQRGARIFDELVVAILRNSEKAPLFTVEERLEMLRECTSQWRMFVSSPLQVCWSTTHEIAAHRRYFAASAPSVTTSMNSQMAWMNRKLDPSLETVFMMPAGAYSYLSSRLVREIASLGGSLEGLVPASVESRLRERFRDVPLASK